MLTVSGVCAQLWCAWPAECSITIENEKYLSEYVVPFVGMVAFVQVSLLPVVPACSSVQLAVRPDVQQIVYIQHDSSQNPWILQKRLQNNRCVFFSASTLAVAFSSRIDSASHRKIAKHASRFWHCAASSTVNSLGSKFWKASMTQFLLLGNYLKMNSEKRRKKSRKID